MKTTSLFLSLAATLCAQSPDASALPADPNPLTEVLRRGVPLHDEGTDLQAGPLGVWGAGSHFKIGFPGDSFVLVPYLGAAAPRSLPWQWRTASVRAGDQELWAAGERQDSHDAWQFRRRRGLVTELWDLHGDHAEQRFLIERPATLPEGELRIRGAVTTPLAAAPREPAVAPLSFASSDGAYALTYGTAMVFDAKGRSAAVPSSYDGESITLHVPAGFVATATWPLHVDPLLTPVGIAIDSSLAFRDFDVDSINGNTSTRRLGIVWTRSASAADSDVYVLRAATDFSGSGIFAFEISAGVDSVEPSIAGSWIDDSMTIAWVRTGTSVDRCYACSFSTSSSTGSLANGLLLTITSGASERKPRVTAPKVMTAAPAQALIVRLRTINGATEVGGSLIGTTTQNQSGYFPIATPNQYADRFTEPSVTKSIRGDYEGWVVAFQFWSVTFQRHVIGLRRVSYTGQVGSQALSINLANPSRHAMRPRIDGSFGRYLLAFSTVSTTAYPGPLTSWNGTAVECQRIDWGATGSPSTPWPARTVQTIAGRSLSVDDVAVSTHDYSHWLVGTRTGGTARVALLGYRGMTIEQDTLPGPTGSGAHVAQDVVIAYTPHTDRFAVLYDHSTSSQGNLTWNCWGVVRSYPELPEPVAYGTSCGVQAPRLFHDFRIGNEFGTIGQPGLQPNQWAVVGLSLASANVPFASFGVPGGCSLRIDPAAQSLIGTFLVFANSAGYAGLQVPLPENLLPLDFYAQIVSEGPIPGSLNASRGVQIAVR